MDEKGGSSYSVKWYEIVLFIVFLGCILTVLVV